MRLSLSALAALAVLALPPRPSCAQLPGGVALSSFFDVRADAGSGPGAVSAGDLELGIAGEIGQHLQVGAAVVLNDEGASLTVALLDLHLFGGLLAPGDLPVEKGVHLQLGRFDVPFGNDWQSFASKDRVELSAPLPTDAVLDGGVNDVGLRVLGKSGGFHYSVVALRGTGEGTLLGGRLAITPFDGPRTRTFEAGVSLLHDLDGDGATEQTSFALDSEVRVGRCRGRAEYVRRDSRRVEGRDGRVVRWGWHVTAAVDAGELAGVPLTPYARYDTAAETSAEGEGRTERLTTGLNASLFRLVTLKLEYRRRLAAPVEVQPGEGSGRNSWGAQLVVAF